MYVCNVPMLPKAVGVELEKLKSIFTACEKNYTINIFMVPLVA